MRRSRRGKSSGLEFGGSGEDSFVAVVVTKLTGALLFILLLTMVIMALLPKAVDSVASSRDSAAKVEAAGDREPLRIGTPSNLPDAVAGRPYLVAFAATGGRGATHWSAEEPLPKWLALDESSGRISGVPPEPTKEPLSFRISASDGADKVGQMVQLAVLPAQTATSAGTWWKPRWRAVAWKAWLEQGFGFLLLWLVHLLGMNLLTSLERQSFAESLAAEGFESGQMSVQKRFATYRILVRLTTLSAMIALAAWLAMSRGH